MPKHAKTKTHTQQLAAQAAESMQSHKEGSKGLYMSLYMSLTASQNPRQLRLSNANTIPSAVL